MTTENIISNDEWGFYLRSATKVMWRFPNPLANDKATVYKIAGDSVMPR